jgi:molybdate transport repressor ModE-like protein
MLDLRRLQILRAVGRTGSLTAAARELSYSTPAVWQQMRRLETEAGAVLMDRHARGVRLTPAGRTLARHAETLLDAARRAEADVRRVGAGEVRVVAFASAAALTVPAAAALATEQPGARVALDDADPDEAVARLREGGADVAVVFAYDDAAPDWPAGARRHLLDERLWVVLPDAHVLAAMPAISAAQLRDVRCLRGRHGVTTAAAPTAVAYGGGDFATVKRLVATGAGVAVVPQLALEPLPPGVVARPLQEESAVRRVYALLPPDRADDGIAAAFATALGAVADTLAGEIAAVAS